MRDLQSLELDQVSGGLEAEFTMNFGASKKDGPFVMGQIKIEFGRDEEPPRSQDRRDPGDEPAFSATAMRPQ